MATFRYKARDKSGALITGEIEASTAEELKEGLFLQGMVPLKVDEIKSGSLSLDSIQDMFNKVKPDQIMVFTRQFYTLFKAGVSVDAILATMAGQMQEKAKKLSDALFQIRADLETGASLSQAFSRHPRVFSELYVSMIDAGEQAGILETVLEKLSDLLQKEFAISKNISGAMMYPKIVVFVLVLAITFLMILVVPKFQEFYGQYDAELPLPTRILIMGSNFVLNYWYIAILGFGTLSFLWNRFKSSRMGRMKVDKLAFKLPVFGDLNLKVANARFGHIMAALYSSGLSMPRCLEVVSRVIGNEAFGKEVEIIRDDIQKGSTLSESISRQSYFPSLLVETTAVGEKSGALDDMLQTVAQHYDMEVDHTIANLTTLLEPIMLGLIFGVVGLLALAIFLPIWSMGEVMG